MIDFIKQNKILTLFIAIFIFGIAYYTFFASKSSKDALLSSDAPAPSVESQHLLLVLTNLRSIKLDGAIFADPVFNSLNDFSVVLLPQPAGRHNPFAPLIANTVVQKTQPPIQLSPVVPIKRTTPTR